MGMTMTRTRTPIVPTALLDVVARARKEAHAGGAAAARKLVEREVRKRCAERYDEGNTGAPSAGWPQ